MTKRLRALIFSLVLLFSFNYHAAAHTGTDDYSALCGKYAADFAAVESWLETKPALKPGDETRERILKRLDAVFQEKDANLLPCSAEYFHTRMDAFKKDFMQKKVESGISVWKLYNHTAIIKTSDATIAIDLYPGSKKLSFTDAELEDLASRMDIILITHVHGDHTTPGAARIFIDKGVKVVAHPGMWKPGKEGADRMAGRTDADYIFSGITYMDTGEIVVNKTKIRIYKSWQKGDRNNVYLIESPDGVKVMHTGDMNVLLFHPDDIWFKKLKSDINIDAVIPNCWSPDLAAMFKRVHPKLIIASHEHELGHPVEGRRTFEYVYKTLSGYRIPFVVPAWGERIDLMPEK